jgi:hypothetical protein
MSASGPSTRSMLSTITVMAARYRASHSRSSDKDEAAISTMLSMASERDPVARQSREDCPPTWDNSSLSKREGETVKSFQCLRMDRSRRRRRGVSRIVGVSRPPVCLKTFSRALRLSLLSTMSASPRTSRGSTWSRSRRAARSATCVSLASASSW